MSFRRLRLTRARFVLALSVACGGAPAPSNPAPSAAPVAPPVTPSAPEPLPAPGRRADLAEEAPEGDPGQSWREQHEALLRAPGRRSAQLVVLGGSLAHGWHGSRAFQKQWRERKPLNLALPRDQTQQLLWRIEHGALDGLAPRLVLLAAGGENLAHGFSAAETVRGVSAVLQRVRERLPGSAVLLLGVLPAGQHPSDPARAASDAANAALRELASAQQAQLADVGGIFLEADGSLTPGMLGDDGQPTALGYQALTISVSLIAKQMLEGSR